MNKAADTVSVALTTGWTWEWWLVCSVVALLVSTLAGVLAAQLCNNRPRCFASNPDPMTMGHLKCHECDERDECLR